MNSDRVFTVKDIEQAAQAAESALERARDDGVLDPVHEQNQMISHLRVGIADTIIERKLTTADEIVAFLREELARLQDARAASTAREARMMVNKFAEALGIRHALTALPPGKSGDISPQ